MHRLPLPSLCGFFARSQAEFVNQDFKGDYR